MASLSEELFPLGLAAGGNGESLDEVLLDDVLSEDFRGDAA